MPSLATSIPRVSDLMPPRLLLVIPCYRESGRLPGFLPGLCEALASAGIPAAIQVCDDGSGPEEVAKLNAIVDSLRMNWPMLRPLVALPENLGKGGAVYAGWALATDEAMVGFVDADGAVSPAETARVVAVALQPSHAATATIAVRLHGVGRTVQRTGIRFLTGIGFRALVQFLFGLPIPDTQCGCKIVPTAAWRALRPMLQEFRFCFDVELLCHLLRHGTPMLAVPIDWTESPGSRIRPSTVGEMLISLLRLRRRLWESGPPPRP
jgi:dolichyl-phosphate beta-glucosyltransferase